MSDVISGFAVVFEPSNLLYCFIGVVIGMLIGVLPGLGPVATISILLPLSYGMTPVGAIIMLAGIFYGAQYGGTITSVLLRLPGETSSVVTVFDGYQMAKKGRAGSALGIAAIGSFIGGTAGILGLMLVAPLLASVALQFGPPEYAVLALLGVVLVASFGSGPRVKNLVAAGIGVLLGTIGLDFFEGTARFTLGNANLIDGLDFVPLAMGLFGVGEILYNLDTAGRHGTGRVMRFANAWPSMADWVQSRWAIARGTVIGFFLGLLPGGGATLASMVSYGVEVRVAKDRTRFGKGAIEGVAGPESANNAAATSSFIPLLTLGIPANATMAVILGALMIQGIAPGPLLISEHPDLFWGVVNSMWVGNLILLVLSIPLVRVFVRLLNVPESLLAPITILIILIGAYTVRFNLNDLLLVVLFGIIGYLMKKTGFDPGPLVLAFILGELLERSVRQSMALMEGNVLGFATRPISGGVLAAVALVLIVLAVRKMRLRRRAHSLDRSDATSL